MRRATKDVKIIIGCRRPEQKMVRGIVPAWFARPDVEKESGGGESIGPKPRGHVGVEQQHADTVVKSAEDPLDATVLLGCVGAREMKGGAVRREKVASGSVVKLFSVVSL